MFDKTQLNSLFTDLKASTYLWFNNLALTTIKPQKVLGYFRAAFLKQSILSNSTTVEMNSYFSSDKNLLDQKNYNVMYKQIREDSICVILTSPMRDAVIRIVQTSNGVPTQYYYYIDFIGSEASVTEAKKFFDK